MVIVTSKLSARIDAINTCVDRTEGSNPTLDQLGSSPNTVVITGLVDLEPLGLGGVELGAITIAGSHVVKDGAEMI